MAKVEIDAKARAKIVGLYTGTSGGDPVNMTNIAQRFGATIGEISRVLDHEGVTRDKRGRMLAYGA